MTEKLPHFVIGKSAKFTLKVSRAADFADLATFTFGSVREIFRQPYKHPFTLRDEIRGSFRS